MASTEGDCKHPVFNGLLQSPFLMEHKWSTVYVEFWGPEFPSDGAENGRVNAMTAQRTASRAPRSRITRPFCRVDKRPQGSQSRGMLQFVSIGVGSVGEKGVNAARR